MKRIDVKELLAGLAEIKDKRRQWGNLRHRLTDILFIILRALMMVSCKACFFIDGKRKQRYNQKESNRAFQCRAAVGRWRG